MKRKNSSRMKTAAAFGSPPKNVASQPAPSAETHSVSTPPAAERAPVIQPEKRPGIGSLRIPAILLEGDLAPAAPASGTGQRYALGPTVLAARMEIKGELPDAYGTRRLLLTARDPHWLYAHWDLTLDQQRQYNARSADRHLILRIFVETPENRPVTEVHVHPESRHWFVHVDRAGTRYVSELGFYDTTGNWESISMSGAALLPPDSPSSNLSVRFATIPYDLTFEQMLSLLKGGMGTDAPFAGLAELARGEVIPESAGVPGQAEFRTAQPKHTGVAGRDPARVAALISSAIAQLLRRHVAGSPGVGAPASLEAAPSSPAGGQPAAQGFWLNVNADLIVYGATDPSATVEIGGRPVPLRRDGSFSCRFALPDGYYELSVVAASADETQGRSAQLTFSRSTAQGVGEQSPDPSLGVPPPGVE